MNFKKITKCLIVAEISSNHARDFGMAVKLIKAAKDCGADAVKLQAYIPESLTIDSNKRYFRIRHPKWGGQTLFQLYKKAATPLSWFKKLKKISDDLNILFFSSAFDRATVDFLEDIGVPFHKIASFELVDLPLIEYAASMGKPLILSTGMASDKEIKEAISTASGHGCKDIMLLKCSSSYPAKPEKMNLKTISHMTRKYGLPVGLSDHTMDIGVSITAALLGAKLIEKHFILSRKIKTPDSFFSMEPYELKALINNIRIAEKATGKVFYGFTSDEKGSRKFRRSLFVVKDMRKHEKFTKENLRSIRPSDGLPPNFFYEIINKRASKNISAGTPLKWDLVCGR